MGISITLGGFGEELTPHCGPMDTHRSLEGFRIKVTDAEVVRGSKARPNWCFLLFQTMPVVSWLVNLTPP